MNKTRILILRTTLIVALAAAVMSVVITQVWLRPELRRISTEREEFKATAAQQHTRALKAEAYGRDLVEQLANEQKRVAEALLESRRFEAGNTRLLVELEETRAKLHSAKQEVARWTATGTTPDQVAFLARENKTLVAKVSQLEKERDQLKRDIAKVKHVLDPVDENATPELPPMKGAVLVVDPKWNFVVLNLGEKEGVRNRGVLMVSRDGKLVGKVQVRRVEGERSIADILPGWRVSEVREGDLVMN